MAQRHLEVVTPKGAVVSEDVDIVTAPGVEGEFGVLANHAPLLSAIKTGTLVFKQDQREKFLMVSSGFVEVSNNTATFLVETAEFGHDIDVDRALQAKERAERRLAMEMAHTDDLDRARAEASLQRSVARLAAAQRTTI
ncbi:MAG: F0F1 ATP synthase subunit epsilon [Candidatus Electrothrix sp. ATG1]|nr:F0F1 ATP synthase subunit epsilon [Candidatus Electrothrix sp. ATG1]